MPQSKQVDFKYKTGKNTFMYAFILNLPTRFLSHALRLLLPRLGDLERENLFLRYQLLVLQRQIKRPQLTKNDRQIVLTFSKLYGLWKDACVLVQPETVLKWHREFAKKLWSHNLGGRPIIDPEIKNVVYRMKRENRLWGPARIHGELIKVGIQISEYSFINIVFYIIA